MALLKKMTGKKAKEAEENKVVSEEVAEKAGEADAAETEKKTVKKASKKTTKKADKEDTAKKEEVPEKPDDTKEDKKGGKAAAKKSSKAEKSADKNDDKEVAEKGEKSEAEKARIAASRKEYGRRRFVSELNKDYVAKEVVTPQVRRRLKAQEKIEKFREIVGRADKVLKMYVDYADSESGDLVGTDAEGLNYVITADKIRALYPKYDPYYSGHLLGTEFSATVESVDDLGNIYLLPVKSSLTEKEFNSFIRGGRAKYSRKDAFERTLHLMLKNKDRRPKVRGTVTKVEMDRIYVDVFDTGVIAVIPRRYYAEKYYHDLRNVCQVGDAMRGIIFDYSAKQGEDEKHFLMNVAHTMKDEGWVKAMNFREGDTIIVKCVEIADGTNQLYFWGVSDLIPGIEAMCDFSTKVPRSEVSVGGCYKCKIKKLDHTRKTIKVVPFEKANMRKNNIEVNW